MLIHVSHPGSHSHAYELQRRLAPPLHPAHVGQLHFLVGKLLVKVSESDGLLSEGLYIGEMARRLKTRLSPPQLFDHRRHTAEGRAPLLVRLRIPRMS